MFAIAQNLGDGKKFIVDRDSIYYIWENFMEQLYKRF